MTSKNLLTPHLISNITANVDLKLPSRISMAKFKGKDVSMTHANIKEITCLVHIYSDLCALVPAARPITMG